MFGHCPEARMLENCGKMSKRSVDGRNPAPPGMYETRKVKLAIDWCRISSIKSATDIL